jgi:carbon-monoxide dehydrogenase medium subunit
VIPAAFTYLRPTSVEEAIALIAADEDAKVLAGGHSLLPIMKLRLAAPSALVDIGRIDGLAYVREEDGVIAIGALTRHHDVATSPLLASGFAAPRRGGRLCRRSLRFATAAPSAAPSCTATRHRICRRRFRARRDLRARRAERQARVVPASEFFLGFLETAIAPDEICTEIRFR